jgi:hypothetical protein
MNFAPLPFIQQASGQIFKEEVKSKKKSQCESEYILYMANFLLAAMSVFQDQE